MIFSKKQYNVSVFLSVFIRINLKNIMIVMKGFQLHHLKPFPQVISPAERL